MVSTLGLSIVSAVCVLVRNHLLPLFANLTGPTTLQGGGHLRFRPDKRSAILRRAAADDWPSLQAPFPHSNNTLRINW